MKKQRIPPDDFSKALLAERSFPEHPPRDWKTPRLWPEKALYGRFRIPIPPPPEMLISPAPDVAAFVLGPTATTALSYDEIRAMLRDMKGPEK